MCGHGIGPAGKGSAINSGNPVVGLEKAARRPASRTRLTKLEEAVVQAVAYSDIFDYPLTVREIHRYLMELPVSRDEVDRVLSNGGLTPDHLTSIDGFFALPGRETIVETRMRRAVQARRDWARAYRYGRIIASLPFVHMVAVTGELAMDNVGPASDIDYFIVTAPGRLWLARLMVIAVVRYGALRGLELCPNYLVSERALDFDDRNLYTAHEIAQMVPISGFETYERMRALNGWLCDFLPNAGGPPRQIEAPARWRPLRRLAERLLRGRVGARLERWEMERKIRKLAGGGRSPAETAYSPDRCKGHVDGHGERILALYYERWQAVKASMQ